jgi:hypothetical protein
MTRQEDPARGVWGGGSPPGTQPRGSSYEINSRLDPMPWSREVRLPGPTRPNWDWPRRTDLVLETHAEHCILLAAARPPLPAHTGDGIYYCHRPEQEMKDHARTLTKRAYHEKIFVCSLAASVPRTKIASHGLVRPEGPGGNRVQGASF